MVAMDAARQIDPILADIAKLDRADQLELAQRLWEDLFTHGTAPDVTASERTLIDERLAAYEAAPDDTLSWDEVEAGILAELRGAG